MNAFQIFWTLPLKERSLGGAKLLNNKDECKREIFSDYYLLAMILSALQWKKLHAGRIKLYTDPTVVEYLTEYGLLSVWDEYDDKTLSEIDAPIEYSSFSSAGKFYVYLKEKAPCIAVDVDLILWKNIESIVKDLEVGFTHWESVETCPWYKPKEYLHIPQGYQFNPNWKWDLMASNTALVYFKSDEFKNYYANEVIKFMTNNFVGGEFNIAKPELLFAEQRLLIMCAEEMNILNKTKPFINAIWNAKLSKFSKHDDNLGEWDFSAINNQELITHIWWHKYQIENTPQLRKQCCYELLDKIISISPDLEIKLLKIKFLKEYVNNYNTRKKRILSL